mgnify:CR=1 FL=1
MAEGSETAAERWNRKYADRSSEAPTEPAAFLKQAVTWMRCRGKALDLAMGAGGNAVFLAERGFEVTGIDISEVGVNHSRRHAQVRGVQIESLVADLASLSLGDSCWDLIVNFYFLDRSLFPKFITALAPGGHFVLETFSTDHPPLGGGFGPKNPAYLLEPNELLSAFAELRVLHYEDLVVDRDEKGRGPAGLIRMVARKEGS